MVDDSEDLVRSLKILLEHAGHAVRAVHEGTAALLAYRTYQPDVVLLDIGLPGMDGFQLAEALRQLPETRDARLIAVSGYGQDNDRALSEAAGFDLHLVKPVDPQRLAAAIAAKAIA